MDKKDNKKPRKNPESKEVKEVKEVKKTKEASKKRPEKVRSRKIGIAVFVIGIIVLIAGVAVLVVKKTAQPLLDDAEFLITAGQWVREDQPEVIWDFTEVGKGTLTTDDHQNDYNFTWKLDNSKITIETDWLYSFYDTFDYTLNQGEKTLTVKNADKDIEIKFIATEKPAETE